ncbi:MAG: hypothetical protein VW644_11240, partial [Alphaproteobacteria bacterium]
LMHGRRGAGFGAGAPATIRPAGAGGPGGAARAIELLRKELTYAQAMVGYANLDGVEHEMIVGPGAAGQRP